MCGYVTKTDHSVHLNPSESDVLEWGDRLIVLANDGRSEYGLASDNRSGSPQLDQCSQVNLQDVSVMALPGCPWRSVTTKPYLVCIVNGAVGCGCVAFLEAFMFALEYGFHCQLGTAFEMSL